MELVLSLQEHALVVLNMNLQLVVTGHRATKQAMLVSRLLPLIVQKLLAELFMTLFILLMILVVFKSMFSNMMMASIVVLSVVF